MSDRNDIDWKQVLQYAKQTEEERKQARAAAREQSKIKYLQSGFGERCAAETAAGKRCKNLGANYDPKKDPEVNDPVLNYEAILYKQSWVVKLCIKLAGVCPCHMKDDFFNGEFKSFFMTEDAKAVFEHICAYRESRRQFIMS